MGRYIIPILLTLVAAFFFFKKDRFESKTFTFQGNLFSNTESKARNGVKNYFYTVKGKDLKYQTTFLQLLFFDKDASLALREASCKAGRNNYGVKPLAGSSGYYFAGAARGIDITVYSVDLDLHGEYSCIFYITAQEKPFNATLSQQQAPKVIQNLKALENTF